MYYPEIIKRANNGYAVPYVFVPFMIGVPHPAPVFIGCPKPSVLNNSWEIKAMYGCKEYPVKKMKFVEKNEISDSPLFLANPARIYFTNWRNYLANKGVGFDYGDDIPEGSIIRVDVQKIWDPGIIQLKYDDTDKIWNRVRSSELKVDALIDVYADNGKDAKIAAHSLVIGMEDQCLKLHIEYLEKHLSDPYE